jgi:hypothetical protein
VPALDGLDSGPPLPPGMSAAPKQGNLASMAGQPGAAPGQSPPSDGAASLQQSVIQDFMLAEKALQSAASKIPAFAPIADQITQMIRAQGARALSQAGQPSGGPASPMQQIMQSVGSAPQM